MSPQATMRRPSVADATIQIELKRRRLRRRRWIRAAVALIVALVLGAGVWLLSFSSVLAADQIEVTGVDTLSVKDVEAAATVPIGVPLARQDVEGIAERVAALRPVESVEVTRDWPHTVRISVVERAPVLAVKDATGFALIDRFGVSYLSVAKVPSGVALAQVAEGDGRLLRQVGDVVAALPTSLREDVATVTAKTADSITLELENGDRVIWGSADQSDLKGQVITALLKRKASVYDVSSPQNPATR